MLLMQHPMLNVAVKSVREASKIILDVVSSNYNITVNKKNGQDLVTNADVEVEKVIINSLMKYFPDHKIICEESGTLGDLNSDYTWIIDPIDGTRNFSHGFPFYCISLALRFRDEIEIGVIYQPICDHLFTAVRGEGAQLNNRKIRVSNINDLQESLVMVNTCRSLVLDQENGGVKFSQFCQLLSHIPYTRFTGASALELAYVSAGMLDGFVMFSGTRIWDFAAGSLLVKEAGGRICNLEGGDDISEGKYIAGNVNIVSKLLKIVSNLDNL